MMNKNLHALYTAKRKGYKTPNTLPWIRTAELYGQQSMSIGCSKVKYPAVMKIVENR